MKLFYLIYFMFVPQFLFAYIDPGTGSPLVYAIIGIASSLWFILKGSFYKLYIKLSKKGKNKSENLKISSQTIAPIVIYSEGNKYFHIFEPVIQSLINLKVNCTYITSDKNDSAFNINSEYFNVVNPGNDLVTISFMNKIQCDIVLATTPHLDIYMWKRSNKVKKYIHLFHAPTGVDYYEKYALSFYDIIFSVGQFTEKAQNYLDTKRGLPHKEYFAIGNTYYDKMVADLENFKTYNSGKTTVLYAPTWGKERSSFFSTGKSFVLDLLNSNFNVIFRPHPQFFTSHKEELIEFSNQTKDLNLIIDKNPSPLESMAKADLLISDYSGIVIDYAYLFQRPILLSTSSTSNIGYEDEELSEEYGFDKKAIQFLGHELTDDEAKNIVNTVNSILSNKTDNKSKILKFRENNIYNFGSAGKAAADAIIKIEESL